MSVDAAFIEALFYISLIVLAPAFYKVSQITTRYLWNRYVSDVEVVVTTKRNGVVVSVQRIKTTGYVVDQLKSVRGST
ncbi:hypothetical protein [Ectopseudomonas guguanensis]|jgi:hypothetical protein|uniref:hypothetical protein n=1 Tax=Ectopseudomonas guguanensis TaxID=1198456 RepID=UPI00285DAACE|nr:hypothetical protein [Pseudomonas guguanensis]MDR8014089.1 hypothetical protein [Pseudomonas guguanensis]